MLGTILSQHAQFKWMMNKWLMSSAFICHLLGPAGVQHLLEIGERGLHTTWGQPEHASPAACSPQAMCWIMGGISCTCISVPCNQRHTISSAPWNYVQEKLYEKDNKKMFCNFLVCFSPVAVFNRFKWTEHWSVWRSFITHTISFNYTISFSLQFQ